jgi:hypothetical protein
MITEVTTTTTSKRYYIANTVLPMGNDKQKTENNHKSSISDLSLLKPDMIHRGQISILVLMAHVDIFFLAVLEETHALSSCFLLGFCPKRHVLLYVHSTVNAYEHMPIRAQFPC